MKRKFILLAMMLLTLIGGVNLNVLNAQETVTIGEGTAINLSNVPCKTDYDNTLSQQIFLSEDFQGKTGNITSYAFKCAKDLSTNYSNYKCNFKIYMTNTDKTSFESASDYVNMSLESLVFEGEVSFQPKDEWTIINFDTPFEYEEGKNVLLCISNSSPYMGVVMTYYSHSTTGYGSISTYADGTPTPFDVTNIIPAKDTKANSNVTHSQFTFEDNTPAVEPSSVPEITSIEATQNSVTLSWNAVENAKKYNVYTSTGDLVNTVRATSCTIEGLDDLTEYCYQVSAVNGEFETEKSTASCATTLEAPKERTLVFELKDSYGDGWNGNYLDVYLNGSLVQSYATTSSDNKNPVTKELTISQGTLIKVVYRGAGSYQYENTFTIYYKDGTLINGQEKISGQGTTTYTVAEFVYGPLLLVEASAYDIFSDQTATLTATAIEFNGDVAYSWFLNGEIVGTGATYTFDPSAAGIYTFTCTATDANNNEASASVTINVTERPALALNVTADKTEIYQGQNTMLYASAIGGFPEYSFNWFLNGEEHGTGSSFYFYQTEVGEYTITCKVTDANGGTIEKSVTVSVLANPFAGKQFRVKVMEGSYAGQYLNVNSHDIVTYPSYWSQDLSTRVGVSPYQESNSQKFTIEMYDSQRFYLRDADGYLIKCDDQTNNYGRNTWDVDAYSTTVGTPLWFDYVGEEQFYIRDYDKYLGNGSTANHSTTHNYFKVQDGLVYCDAPIDLNDGENHRVVLWSLEEVLPVIENLVASKTQLYPGETTTLTWDAFEGAASYNIYVNSELKANPTETSYELSGLTYNVNGNTIEVFAVDENNVEISGKASVIVQVAGTFTLTVNVTDGTNNPIEGATVNVTTDQWTYDEFGNNIASLSSLLTDENGQAVFNNVKLLNPNTYCAYSISATKDVYGTHSTTPLANYESVANGGNVTRTIVMTLPEPKNITADKELYIAGEDVVLTWETPEFNTRAFLGYNVYSVIDGDNDLGTETSYIKLNEETLTETTYTIENVEYDAKFAVSAVYNEGESSKVNANVQITTYANLVVNVKDANTLAGIDGAVVEIYSYRTGETETFVTANGGIVEEEYLLGYYTVTVKKNDSHYEVEPQEAQLVSGDGAELEFELTPKASIENVTVTADNNGNVSWTGDYAKWNVYRRNTNAPQELIPVATELEAKSTTDAAWETLEPGTYQYGVAALVEPQAQTRGTEVIFEEGFENNGEWPDGWTRYTQNSYNNWLIYNSNSHSDSYCAGIYSYQTSSYDRWLRTPEIELNTSSPILRFYFKHIQYQSYSIENEFTVKVKGEDNNWINVYDNEEFQGEYTLVEVPLEGKYTGNKIQIEFYCYTGYYSYIYIDDISIVSPSSETETQIVWSNDVVKQGPATFIGGDTENPTAWNVDANWSTGSVPADGAEVTINANAVITGAVNVSNLTINQGDSYPYNKLTVANGGALTVTGTISQASNYLLVLEEGGQIFQNNANVTARFSMSIDNPTDWSTSNKDGWQFISMPLENVSHADFTSYGEYDLYKYDGSQNLEWQNHKDGGFDYGGVPETTFKSGVGYLASLKDAETATVYGTLNTSTSFSSYFAYNADKDLANFRLIGNPFTYDIKWGDMNPHQLADGFAIVNKDGGYEYYSAPDADIKVGQGFFIKAIAGETSYSQYNYSKQDNYSKQRSTRESNNSLNITATGNAGKDNVVINFAGKSEGFDKLQNFNDAIATVYVAEDGKNYGIYNCDADVQEVELSFNANKMGNYTISIEPNGKFETVTLVDRFTGVETNMLVEDYNFTAMSEENPNRFIVRFANGQQTTDNSHFVYQSGEELILNIQGEVQIVDVLGRVVYNGEAMNDINRINVSSFNSGAYMVKVMNGNEVKVEKVVIY